MKKLLLGAVLALSLSAAQAFAADVKKGDLSLEGAWARASAGMAANGAAFLTIVNTGAAADRLVAAASPVAEKVELHNHLMEGGVMKMRRIDGIDLDPGAPVQLRPGSLHVMLIGLKAPLKSGTAIPITLIFEKAGPVEIEASVMDAGAMGPGGPMGGHKMH